MVTASRKQQLPPRCSVSWGQPASGPLNNSNKERLAIQNKNPEAGLTACVSSDCGACKPAESRQHPARAATPAPSPHAPGPAGHPHGQTHGSARLAPSQQHASRRWLSPCPLHGDRDRTSPHHRHGAGGVSRLAKTPISTARLCSLALLCYPA